jgi:hypothetical protein
MRAHARRRLAGVSSAGPVWAMASTSARLSPPATYLRGAGPGGGGKPAVVELSSWGAGPQLGGPARAGGRQG